MPIVIAVIDDCRAAVVDVAGAATVAVAVSLLTNHSSVANKSNQCCSVAATKVLLPC